MQIKSTSSAVLFEADVLTVRECLEIALQYGVDLQGANLRCADLENANLRYANFCAADLQGANFAGASIQGVRFERARFSGHTTLETGETWKRYLAEVVPALLAAGGRPLAEILTETNWECHSWKNCPLAEAFRVHSFDEVPLLFRPRAKQFVRYFDDGLIPLDLQPRHESAAN